MHTITKRQETADMRSWLEDCGADVDGRSDGEVRREVDRVYVGGVAQFSRDYAPSAVHVADIRVGAEGYVGGMVIA